MKKFNINNIYLDDGKTLSEIIGKYFMTFLDEDLNKLENNEVIHY